MPDQIPLPLPDGVRLHVESSGPAEAPLTVLLVHGWTLDGRIWHRQVSALSEALGDSVRVLTYDARGHGRSGCTALRSATLAQLGDDLAEVLEQVAPTGPVVLAGHSMGGTTIMEYAHRHPETFASRVAGLVFVATTAEGHTHTAYGLSPRIARLIRLAETTGAGVLARCGSWRPPRALLRALRPTLRWLLFGDVCDPADIRLATSAVARASLRSIGGFRPSIGAQHRLETLAAPCAVPAAALVGDRDRITPPPCAESIAGALPTTELTFCAGAGHMLMLERPEEVSAAIIGVSRRVVASHDKAGIEFARTEPARTEPAGIAAANAGRATPMGQAAARAGRHRPAPPEKDGGLAAAA